MATAILLTHERVDDIPLLLGLMQRLELPRLVDAHVGNHGNQEGLTNGWLVTVWLAFILSAGDHRKSTVRDWAARHQHTLERLLGQPIRATDFTDDRLGIVLRRLSHPAAWHALEGALWQATLLVYDLPLTSIRLDSTTVAGYHAPTEDGLMQYGQSKDQQPHLRQFKLMAAAAEPHGLPVAADVVAGQRADDPLYLPLLHRVRQIVGRTGLLYTGDSKMAALATRADIVAHGDAYLLPLPLTGDTPALLATWVDAVVVGDQAVQLIWEGDTLLGAGYTLERICTAVHAGQPLCWTEQVQIVRSRSQAHQQTAGLTQRVAQAEAALSRLTPAPGPGKRQYRDELRLATAVAAVLARHAVTGLLHVAWQREETVQTRYVGAGRGGAARPTRTTTTVRYQITTVTPDTAAITAQTYRFGWRALATTVAAAQMDVAQAERHYRGGWCAERGFHLLKDRPLGIGPLYVQRDDQIAGLTQLLLLGWRLLILIETQVRAGLAQDEATLTGLYPGQATRATARPTATRLLRAVAAAELTLTGLTQGAVVHWHLTDLPAWVTQILGYLGLTPALYQQLTNDTS
jgi:transposase